MNRLVKKEFQRIKCPVCGYEYLPCEIFIPKYLFTKPYQIVRDKQGRIEYVLGERACKTEQYQCDKCDSTFFIHCRTAFFTDKEPPIEWGEDNV